MMKLFNAYKNVWHSKKRKIRHRINKLTNFKANSDSSELNLSVRQMKIIKYEHNSSNSKKTSREQSKKVIH